MADETVNDISIENEEYENNLVQLYKSKFDYIFQKRGKSAAYLLYYKTGNIG